MSLMSILVGTLVSAWGAWSVGAWPCPLEVMQDRAGSLELGETKPCTERRRGSFGGECRENAKHPEVRVKRKVY